MFDKIFGMIAFDVERDAERQRRTDYAEMWSRPDAEPDPEPIATAQGAAMAKASPAAPHGSFWRAIRRLTGTA